MIPGFQVRWVSLLGPVVDISNSATDTVAAMSQFDSENIGQLNHQFNETHLNRTLRTKPSTRSVSPPSWLPLLPFILLLRFPSSSTAIPLPTSFPLLNAKI